MLAIKNIIKSAVLERY